MTTRQRDTVRTVLMLYVLVETRRVLIWIVVAAFFAVALAPDVGWVERRVSWCGRALATLFVCSCSPT